MAKSLTADVHRIIRKNKTLMTMVVQEATQDLIHATQVPKAKGGKMPLDTGFLRASGRLSLSGVPSGPVRGKPKAQPGSYTAPENVTVAGFQLGGSIFWGWTAIYARRQELRNGFLRSNVRQWQKFVDGAVRKLRGKMR